MKKERKEKKYKDKGWLEEQYLKKERLTWEIAEECEVSTMTILRYLERFKIPKRSREEATKLGFLKSGWADARSSETKRKSEADKKYYEKMKGKIKRGCRDV